MQDIVWVYGISFPKGLENRTDRTGDVIYKGQITYMRKFIDYEFPFEGGIRKHSSPLEIYTRLEGGKDPSEKVFTKEKEYKEMPVLGSTSFEKLFGEAGPKVGSKQN
ncbi:MAG: hypothetical protein IPF67_16385 [Saprospiraceae bacterium]|nr:hypothetical protein [Candidatus Brachybacter algidus]